MMVGVTPPETTCGMRSRTEYCIQTNGIYRECDFCEDTEPSKRHPPEYLTDIHQDFNGTAWQSVTMLEDVHARSVNLTVNLGKCNNRALSAASAAKFNMAAVRWQYPSHVAIVPTESKGKTEGNDWDTACGNFKTLISSIYHNKKCACFFS
jgi:hypothetical protein